MSPAEWRDLPPWERELLRDGMQREFGEDERNRSSRAERDGDGSLNAPPAHLMRHL